MKTGALLLTVLFLKLSSAMAITNSSPAIEEVFDAVVQIKTQGIDQTDGSKTPGYCNATIISETHLVTAAHCLVHSHVLNTKVIEVDLGRYKYVKNFAGQIVRVGYVPFYTQIEMNPDLIFRKSLIKKMKMFGLKTQTMPYEDMAVIKLKKALPLKEYKITPLKIMSQKLWNKLIQNPTLAVTAASINYVAAVTSSDVRRKADLDNTQIIKNLEGYYIKSESNSRVEPLDSGAPVIAKVDSDYYIVALTKGRAILGEINWDVFPILVYSLPSLYFNN